MDEIIVLASGSPRRRELLTQIGIRFEVIPALSEERTQSSDPEEICRSLAAVKAEEVAQRITDARPAYNTQESEDRRTEYSEESAAGQTEVRSISGEEAARHTENRNTSGEAVISSVPVGGIPRDVAASRRVRVIGADTIVVLRREILGKPKDAADAARMLAALSGRAHEVMTGVCVIDICEGRRVSEASFSECTKVFVSRLTPQEIEDYIATGEPFDKAGSYGIQGVFARYIERIDGDYNNVVGLPVGRLYREFFSEQSETADAAPNASFLPRHACEQN